MAKNPRTARVGDTYGIWTVIEELDPSPSGVRRVLARTDSGVEKAMTVHNLKQIRTGIRRGRPLIVDDNYRVWSRYKKGAAARGIMFHLSVADVADLIRERCFYCGAEPKMVAYQGMTYNGIDRKDSTGGYHVSNVVPCCSRCNIKKGTDDFDDFIAWAKRVAAHNS